MVRHVDLWRTYGSGERVRSTLLRQGRERGKRLASAVLRRSLLSSSNEVLGAGLIVGAILLMPLLNVDPAHALSLVALVFLAYRPLRDFGDARTTWARGEIAASWLSPWLTSDEEALSTPTAYASWAPQTLRLDGFGAKRHTARSSFELRAGEIIAIVGANGAGKTTLLRALLGLEPADGSLFYGDRSLADSGVGPSARPFAWVPQDPPVITGTLDDNLDLSGRNSVDARSELDALGGAALMRDLEGVELGASGRAISAGERAWISIARAVSTGLPVLLLDEPTASLSPESEARVLDLLVRIRDHRAVLIVTHRPAPTSIASRVLRLDGSTTGDLRAERAVG
jgi:ABC-type transport system involved in cytochrome bd biosynthesis fused ATPase/permease subunit